MTKHPEGTTDPRVATLQAEAEAFRAELAATEERIAHLMANEDPAAGVYHHEDIHAAKQERMRLRVEVDLRKRKLRRIELGMDPDVDPALDQDSQGTGTGSGTGPGSGWLF